jgi:Flp pilus assembly protein TadG
MANLLHRSEALRIGLLREGVAMVEAVFVLPCLLFVIVGALDWGFFSYALIVTQDAARGAALYTSTSPATASDATGACSAVLANFTAVPNISKTLTTCNGTPLLVTVSAPTGPDGAQSTLVTVSYTCMPMIPIPGLLMGNPTITRSVQMKVRS